MKWEMGSHLLFFLREWQIEIAPGRTFVRHRNNKNGIFLDILTIFFSVILKKL